MCSVIEGAFPARCEKLPAGAGRGLHEGLNITFQRAAHHRVALAHKDSRTSMSYPPERRPTTGREEGTMASWRMRSPSQFHRRDHTMPEWVMRKCEGVGGRRVAMKCKEVAAAVSGRTRAQWPEWGAGGGGSPLTDTRSNRITPPGQAQGRVLDWPAWAGKAVGNRAHRAAACCGGTR